MIWNVQARVGIWIRKQNVSGACLLTYFPSDFRYLVISLYICESKLSAAILKLFSCSLPDSRRKAISLNYCYWHEIESIGDECCIWYHVFVFQKNGCFDWVLRKFKSMLIKCQQNRLILSLTVREQNISVWEHIYYYLTVWGNLFLDWCPFQMKK